MKHTIIKPAAAILLLAALVTGCVSVPDKAAVISPRPERMMWEITAPTGTTVYILGTIHLADTETATLPEPVLAAFDSADERFGELSAPDMMQLEQHILMKVNDTLLLNENGEPVSITSFLSPDEVTCLNQTMEQALGQAYTQDVFTALTLLPPWYWINLLNTMEMERSGYTAVQGIDVQLYIRAAINGLEIAGLDAVETQLDLLSYGSTEDHITILKQMIADMQTGKSQESLEEMVFLYKQDNREKLKIYLEQEMQETDGLSEGYITGYLDNLIKERNRNWANQITEMLQEPDKTYFIFGGAAHWLVFPSVFDMLIKDGSAVMVQ